MSYLRLLKSLVPPFFPYKAATKKKKILIKINRKIISLLFYSFISPFMLKISKNGVKNNKNRGYLCAEQDSMIKVDSSMMRIVRYL